MKQNQQQMYRIHGAKCDWCHKGRRKMVNLFHPAQPVAELDVPRDYFQIALCAGCLRCALKITEAPDG